MLSALALSLLTLLVPPALARDAERPPMEPFGARSPVGLGLSVLGGGLVGFDVAWRPTRDNTLSAGVQPRLGLGDDVYGNLMFTAGGAHYYGDDRFSVGPFGRIGSTLPVPYFEVFAAAGVSLRIESSTRRATHSFSLGPGVFPIRDIPQSVAEQGRGLIYLNYAVHFYSGG